MIFKQKILIIGGGTAGITTAARLRRKGFQEISIIDQNHLHYYQPMFTLVGGGAANIDSTFKSMNSVIPQGGHWIPFNVSEIDGNGCKVRLNNGRELDYDHLVICPGIKIDWNKIEGLEKSLGMFGVCSNYSTEKVTKTWDVIKSTKEGTAIFTFPNTPIKCGGAPQKIMYLAENYFRNMDFRKNIKVIFVSAGASIFGVKKYAEALSKIVGDRGIETLYNHNLTKIDYQNKIATFHHMNTGEDVEMEFSMLHVTPPMSSPEFIASSNLGNEQGWVDVDKFTLQHTKFKNIFSLGDASSLPTAKTGAAIRKQSPILVENLVSSIHGKELSEKYDGYTSCPLVTGYGKLILAEFDYQGNPAETFPFNQAKERFSMYLLKKYGLPFMYWNGMLKGLA